LTNLFITVLFFRLYRV